MKDYIIDLLNNLVNSNFFSLFTSGLLVIASTTDKTKLDKIAVAKIGFENNVLNNTKNNRRSRMGGNGARLAPLPVDLMLFF